MWFIGVEVEQETSAPPHKKKPGSARGLNLTIFPGTGPKRPDSENQKRKEPLKITKLYDFTFYREKQSCFFVRKRLQYTHKHTLKHTHLLLYRKVTSSTCPQIAMANQKQTNILTSSKTLNTRTTRPTAI